MLRARLLHQMISSGPVAVAIEQRPDDAATQYPGKGFLPGCPIEGGNDFVTVREAANVQALFVSRPTTKASIVGRVSFLDTFFHNVQCPMSNVQSQKSKRALPTLDFGRSTLDIP